MNENPRRHHGVQHTGQAAINSAPSRLCPLRSPHGVPLSLSRSLARCLLLISRDVRPARGNCPRAQGAAETRWLCAQEEPRKRAEAMQRRMKRGARISLPCVLSCQKSSSSAEKEKSGSGMKLIGFRYHLR